MVHYGQRITFALGSGLDFGGSAITALGGVLDLDFIEGEFVSLCVAIFELRTDASGCVNVFATVRGRTSVVVTEMLLSTADSFTGATPVPTASFEAFRVDLLLPTEGA
jgi:hypothetical protein